MAKVKILVDGRHQFKGDRLYINATITLIKADKNIIVDPGSFIDQDNLIKALAQEELNPSDIDIVFLTHLHLDHIANVHLFKQAKIYLKLSQDYAGQYNVLNQGYLTRVNIQDGLKLAKDVEYLLTPGHTKDHVSLLVYTPQGKIIIAGDALAKESLANLNKTPELCDNLEQYNVSRQKILELADMIIPGHGKIFINQKNASL